MKIKWCLWNEGRVGEYVSDIVEWKGIISYEESDK